MDIVIKCAVAIKTIGRIVEPALHLLGQRLCGDAIASRNGWKVGLLLVF